MTSFSPCRRCSRRDACERLADLRKTMRGTGITKASVKCDIPKVDFPVGQPVSVRTFTLAWGEYGDEGYRRIPVSRLGVVRRHRADKFLVLLNVGQEVGEPDIGEPGSDARPIAIVSAYHDQLARIEGQEGLVELCDCGLTADRCGDASRHPRLRSGWACVGKGLEEADHG